MATSVVVAGVGGQGVLLAAGVIARAALACGLAAQQTEVRGVAQRGGSVVSHVRFGPEAASPLVPEGSAQAVVGLERLEGLRQAHYARPGGCLVLSRLVLPPVRFPGDERPYPEDAAGLAGELGLRLVELDAEGLARRLGSERLASVVVLGALSRELELPLEAWEAGIRKGVPAGTVEANLAAFRAGRAARHRRGRQP